MANFASGLPKIISELGSKVTKHVKKHPIKYTAGAAAVTGFGFAKTHSKQEKKLKTYFGSLPPHDARYKALRKGGFITEKQHRYNVSLWKK